MLKKKQPHEEEVDNKKNICNMKSKQCNKDILQENQRLNKIVKEQTHIIKELQEEREKLKNEIFNLNDDVINSLRQERDDFLESKFMYQDKARKYEQIISEMEDERAVLKSKILAYEKLEASAKLDEYLDVTENKKNRYMWSISQFQLKKRRVTILKILPRSLTRVLT